MEKEIKNIYLLGGGEIAKGETEMIDRSVMDNAPQGGTLVFFGTAASDAPGYMTAIGNVYGKHFAVVSATKEKGRSFAQDAIRDADVIYLGGGFTQSLLELFEEWQLVPTLRDALKRGTLVVGMSAGAQALSSWYIHEDEEDGSQELRQGWGLVDPSICVLVHAREESSVKANALCAKSADAKACQLLGIGEGAAWRVGMDDTEGEKVGKDALWLLG